MAKVRALSPQRLGHTDIDSDHSQIARCWFQAANCLPIQFPYFITRLRKVMRDHFDREAEIMSGYDSDLCACHRHEHDALLGLCDTAYRLSHDDWEQAQALLRSEFPRMVREHIICMDQMVVMCINTNGEIGRADPRCSCG
jgi:hemerythrin